METHRPPDMRAVRRVLSVATLSLRVRPAVHAWEALERELKTLGVPDGIRDELACAALEAITVAAFRGRSTVAPGAPPTPAPEAPPPSDGGGE